MAYKIVRDNLLNLLNNYYEPKGYKLNHKFALFQKGQNIVFWGPSTKHFDSMTLKPQLHIKNEEIKLIIQRVLPEELSFTNVAGSQSDLVELYEDSAVFNSIYLSRRNAPFYSYYYNISEKTNLTPIIEDHIKFMEIIGYSFFEKYSDLKSISNIVVKGFLEKPIQMDLPNFHQVLGNQMFGKHGIVSGYIASHLIKIEYLVELTDKIQSVFAGNEFVLSDIRKINNYFLNGIEQ